MLNALNSALPTPLTAEQLSSAVEVSATPSTRAASNDPFAAASARFLASPSSSAASSSSSPAAAGSGAAPATSALKPNAVWPVARLISSQFKSVLVNQAFGSLVLLICSCFCRLSW